MKERMKISMRTTFYKRAVKVRKFFLLLLPNYSRISQIIWCRTVGWGNPCWDHQSGDISRILLIDRMILPPAGISCLKNRISYLIMRKYPHAQQNCSLHMFWRLNNDYNFRVLQAGIHPFFVIIKHKLVPHLNSFLLVGPKWIFSNLTFNFECDLF